MTICKVLGTFLVDDNTDIWIRNRRMEALAHGNWYQDGVLAYLNNETECFTWTDDNSITFVLKGG